MAVFGTGSAQAEKEAVRAATAADDTDLPPPYSPIEEDHPCATVSRPAPEYADLAAPTVLHPRPGVVVVTNELAPTRALYLHADKVHSSSLIVESDHGPSANGMILLRVEFSGGGPDIKDQCDVSMAANASGEYEIHAFCRRSSAKVECRFIVQIPANAPVVHPGIRAVLSKGHIGVGGLANVSFGHIDLQTDRASVSLSHVCSGAITVRSSHDAIDVANIDCQGALFLETHSGHISVTDVSCRNLHATTTDKPITLQSCASDVVFASTTHCKLQCRGAVSKVMRLQTTNYHIEADGVDAGSLRMSTTNARVYGTWNVRDLLDVSTTNAKIMADIGLPEPGLPVSITLTTTNAAIEARLKRSAFSGRFDLKTTNGAAQLLCDGDGEGSDGALPLRYVVNTKSYVRGSHGAGDKLRHELAAKTTNAKVHVALTED
ncbi:hypothetical protein H4R21_000397 [Coemansia helicoidea]|uniref:Uncharacterized protein n=2 Tax=Coemansia TaxID=4863 RepID=A0ACC1LFX2_9FUNG|nr:hypothetical protein H4R21_000397 [Coemansia helicoidea]